MKGDTGTSKECEKQNEGRYEWGRIWKKAWL